jgi:C4-dicarboxylate-specific signal transduction histidine kinase
MEVSVLQYRVDGVTYTKTVARDIAERKDAEAERPNLEAQLVQAQKMESIGRLVGTVVDPLPGAERESESNISRNL